MRKSNLTSERPLVQLT